VGLRVKHRNDNTQADENALPNRVETSIIRKETFLTNLAGRALEPRQAGYTQYYTGGEKDENVTYRPSKLAEEFSGDVSSTPAVASNLWTGIDWGGRAVPTHDFTLDTREEKNATKRTSW